MDKMTDILDEKTGGEKMEGKAIRFGIEGKWLTDFVRQQVFMEGKDPKHMIETMRGFMCGTDQSDVEIDRLAEDVLLGRAEFRGNPREDTWHLTTFAAGEEPDDWNVFEKITEIAKKNKILEDQLAVLNEKYSAALEVMYDSQRDSFLQSIGETPKASISPILKGFLDRVGDKKSHETADYGWLEPDGTFHEVEWGEHTKWADDYMREHMPIEEWLENEFYNSGDYLTQRGWVLLHNPAQGIAIPTKDPAKRYTKAQRDFLYGYYTDRNQNDRANEIMEDRTT